MCQQKPSLMQGFLSNWKNSRAPFFTKLGMALKNNFIKLLNGQNCCGHYGAVGC